MLEDEFIELFGENNWCDIKKKEAYEFVRQIYDDMSVDDLRIERAKLVALERKSSLSYGKALTITPMFISILAVAIAMLFKSNMTYPVACGNSIIDIGYWLLIFLWAVLTFVIVFGIIRSMYERYGYAQKCARYAYHLQVLEDMMLRNDKNIEKDI